MKLNKYFFILVVIATLCGIFGFFIDSFSAMPTFVFFSIGPGLIVGEMVFGNLRPFKKIWVSVVFSPLALVLVLLLLVWGLELSLAEASHIIRLILIVGLPAIAFVSLKRRKLAADDIDALPPASLLWLIAFFAILIIFSYSNPANQLSVHGIFHGAHIEQIKNAIVPPDNPAIAGDTARNYWAYHLFYAFMSETAGIPFFKVSAIYQTAVFVLYTFGIWLVVSQFFQNKSDTLITFLSAFGVNLLGPIALLLVIAVNGWNVEWWHLRSIISGLGLWLAPEVRAGIFVKFLSFNGFIFGLLYFSALALFAFERRYVGASLAVLGLVVLHPQTAMFSVPVFGVAWFWRELYERACVTRSGLSGIITALRTMIVDLTIVKLATSFSLPFILASPYILSFMSGGSTKSLFKFQPNLFSAVNWPLLYLLPLPFAIWGAIIAMRSRSPNAQFFISGAAMALVFAFFFDMPLYTQYKFLYLNCMFVWALAFLGMRHIGASLFVQWVSKIFGFLAIGGATSLVLAFATLPSWFGHRVLFPIENGFSFSVAAEESRALYNLSKLLPQRAVFVEFAEFCENSIVGVITGRRSYYSPCNYFSETSPHRAEREEIIAQIFNSNTPNLGLFSKIAATIGDPLYLLVSKRQLGEKFDQFLAAVYADSDDFSNVETNEDHVKIFKYTGKTFRG